MDYCDLMPLNPFCLVDGAVEAVGSTIFDGIARAFTSAVEAIMDATFDAISAATTVDLSAEHIGRNAAVLTSVALVIIVGLFVVQVIAAAIRQEPGALGRAVAGSGAAVLGTAASVAVIQALLIAVDGICEALASVAGTSIEEAARRLLDISLLTSVTGPGAGAILVIIFGTLYIVGAALTLATLLVRSALIIVAVVVAPIAIAGGTARVTSGWVRRWAKVTLALILSKLAIVIVFVVAVGLLGGATGIGALLSGVILILLACLAPWATFKFLDFAGTSLASEMQRVATGGTRAVAQGTRTAAHTMMRTVAPIVGGAAGAGTALASTAAGRSSGPSGPPSSGGGPLFSPTNGATAGGVSVRPSPTPGHTSATSAPASPGGTTPSPAQTPSPPDPVAPAAPSVPAIPRSHS